MAHRSTCNNLANKTPLFVTTPSSPHAYSLGAARAAARARGCNQHECDLIFAHVLSVSLAFILAHDDFALDIDARTHSEDLIARRIAGEPLAYLTGSKEFYGRSFAVTPHTLIPRPETELLVEQALVCLAQTHATAPKDPPTLVVDCGTGSGAIIVTLAAECAQRYSAHRYGFLATDISRDALIVADRNAHTHGVADQIAFIAAHLITPLLTIQSIHRLFALGTHLVLCANLPYVDRALYETLTKKPESRGLLYEPAHALWADDGGLSLYKELLVQLLDLFPHITGSCTLLCEIAPNHATTLIDYAHTLLPGMRSATVHKDLSNRDRLVQFSLQ